MELEILKVIKCSVCEGKGTKESIARNVDYYYTMDGHLIFRKDCLEKIENLQMKVPNICGNGEAK